MDEIKSELVKGIASTTEKALEFIEKLVAGPLMEGTGRLTDKVKYWRFKNQVDIILKAKEYLKLKGIKTPKKIGIKDLSTLLEYASFEEEEIMQDSWAKLLANTMNPDNIFNSSNVFSQILNQLSVNEVYIIGYIFKKCFIMSSEHRPYFEKKDLERKGNTDLNTASLLIDNLLRLRLIEEEAPKLIKEIKRSKDSFEDDELFTKIIASNKFRLSKLGLELSRQIFN